MAAINAIAITAAFNHVDPRVDPGLSAPDRYEALLGRRLGPTPAHLTSRVLYVPSHNDKVTHLPVYDFTSDFREAVRDEPLGSSRFKTSFGLMHKPSGDGRGTSSVSYLVDFDAPGMAAGQRRRSSGLGGGGGGGGLTTRASVRRRMLFGGGAEVGLTIPPRWSPGADARDGEVACTITPTTTTTDIPLAVSFPLAPTVSRFGSSRNAWFTFTVPSLLDDERTLQWQTHPVEHGMLRYTLVELPPRGAPGAEDGKPPFSAADPANEGLIRAVYFNVGLGFSLSQPFSEGALLLQNDLEPELEALIVASLLGLLWRVRNEESKPRKNSNAAGPAAAKEGAVDEGPASPPAPGKKRRLSKIFGKK